MKVGVFGGGAWGTALAAAACRAKTEHDVLLWARDAEIVGEINENKTNERYLPGLALPKGLQATNQLSDLEECGIGLLVIPAQQLRHVLPGLLANWRAEIPLLLCAKGIDRETGELPLEILERCASGQTAGVLSGPSFAADVVSGKPTAVTLAARDASSASDWAAILGGPTFRPYVAADLIGVELGGALKNVYAICCGMSDGRDLGASAKAALIARGFSEMVRFGVALGARAETFMGLSGLGDLVLTCGSTQSRNYALGFEIGRQPTRKLDWNHADRPLAEGAFTARIAADKAREHSLDLPILQAVADILDGQLDVDAAIQSLLQRPLRSEQ